MRAVLAVALSLGLGACATSGNGPPTIDDVAGFYDLNTDLGIEKSRLISWILAQRGYKDLRREARSSIGEEHSRRIFYGIGGLRQGHASGRSHAP